MSLRTSQVFALSFVTLVTIAAIGQDQPPPGDPHHGLAKPMVLRIEVGEGAKARSASSDLSLTFTGGEDLNTPVTLPAGFPALVVRQFLPAAEVQQEIQASEAPDARAAVQLTIVGPAQTEKLWLLADEPGRNKLNCPIGSWTHVRLKDAAERDAMLEKFKSELLRAPKLIVAGEGGASKQEVSGREGTTAEVLEGKATVKVTRFFPHFRKTAQGEAFNESERMVNPAALVHIELGDQKEDRWVFARTMAAHGAETRKLPVWIQLDAPVTNAEATPTFVLVTIGKALTEIWTRDGDQAGAAPVKMSEKLPVGKTGFTFAVDQYSPSGKLVESYRHTLQAHRAVAAIQLMVTEEGGQAVPVWLERGRPKKIPTKGGDATLVFDYRDPPSPHGGR